MGFLYGLDWWAWAEAATAVMVMVMMWPYMLGRLLLRGRGERAGGGGVETELGNTMLLCLCVQELEASRRGCLVRYGDGDGNTFLKDSMNYANELSWMAIAIH